MGWKHIFLPYLAWCLHNDKAERGTSKQPDKAPVTKERRGGRSLTQETLGIIRGGGGSRALDPPTEPPNPPPRPIATYFLLTKPDPGLSGKFRPPWCKKHVTPCQEYGILRFSVEGIHRGEVVCVGECLKHSAQGLGIGLTVWRNHHCKQTFQPRHSSRDMPGSEKWRQ